MASPAVGRGDHGLSLSRWCPGPRGLPTQNRSGPGASAFDILDPRVQSSERSIDAFGVSGLIDTVRVQKGSTFRYKVSIRNDGPFPVTIKAIDGGGRVSRQVVAVNLPPYENGSGFGPFVPFPLDPHEEAFIEIRHEWIHPTRC